MECLVIAAFKTNPGSTDDLAALFKEALPVTRAFAGCKGIVDGVKRLGQPTAL